MTTPDSVSFALFLLAVALAVAHALDDLDEFDELDSGDDMRGRSGKGRALRDEKTFDENRVNLGRADEIIDRQTTLSLIHAMRVKADDTAVVGHHQFRMVVLSMDHIGDRIHEGQRLVVILEAKTFRQFGVSKSCVVNVMIWSWFK